MEFRIRSGLWLGSGKTSAEGNVLLSPTRLSRNERESKTGGESSGGGGGIATSGCTQQLA